MRQIDMYICSPFRGKCKLYNRPEFECPHAVPHRKVNEYDMGYCSDERDAVCGGICRKIKVAKVHHTTARSKNRL